MTKKLALKKKKNKSKRPCHNHPKSLTRATSSKEIKILKQLADPREVSRAIKHETHADKI
jgi:hypothetical protein